MLETIPQTPTRRRCASPASATAPTRTAAHAYGARAPESTLTRSPDRDRSGVMSGTVYLLHLDAPGCRRRAHGTVSVVRRLPPGAGGGRAARSAVSRPAAHRATLAAATGATLTELMARPGHSTVSAALRYQHAAAERDKVIAAALSELAGGTVTPITRARVKASRQQAGR